MPQAEIQIHVFGEGALQLYKQRVMDWHRSPHNKMLLAFLATHPRGVTTEEIRTFLWPDAPNPAAIHTAVKKRRDLIGGAHIVNQNGIYMLNGDTWLDTTEYELLYVRARQKPLVERLDDHRQATQLYRGDFLQGFNNLWVVEERERLRNMQAWLLWTIAAI